VVFRGFRRNEVGPALLPFRRRRTLSIRHIRSHVGCGVFYFLAILSASCALPETQSESIPTTITIGFPEGNFREISGGLREIARLLSQEGLTSVGRDGRAEPRIAETWSWQENGLKLQIKLRENIKQHDGTALTASVVAEALKAAVSRPDNQGAYWSFKAIKEIRAFGEDGLVIELTQPAGELPEDLQVPLTFGVDDDGIGPYQVVKNDASGVVLDRFVSYYGGTPHIAQVQIRRYETLRTAWASLLRGEIDLVTNVPADVLEFVGNDRITVTSFLRWYEYVIAFNSTRRPFSSPAVRRALNLAINRDELVSKVFKGKGMGATGPLWPEHWAYDSSLQPQVFDPERAEAALDQAGIPRRSASVKGSESREQRFSFTCLVLANFSTDERIALHVQKQLYDIGVDMQFETVPAEEYPGRITSGEFDAVLIDMVSGPTFGRPHLFWSSAQRAKGQFNIFGYENAEAEELFDVLRESTNEGAVRTAARRLQRVMLDDPPALFLAWSERARAINRRFDIPQEPGRDPLSTLWRWTPKTTLTSNRAAP